MAGAGRRTLGVPTWVLAVLAALALAAWFYRETIAQVLRAVATVDRNQAAVDELGQTVATLGGDARRAGDALAGWLERKLDQGTSPY
jgi:cell division protein FtsB